jgi:hypothetical protein
MRPLSQSNSYYDVWFSNVGAIRVQANNRTSAYWKAAKLVCKGSENTSKQVKKVIKIKLIYL